MFVGDEDSIEIVDRFFDGGEAGQRFALAEAAVHQEAGALGFEQRDVARTTGRQNGNAQAYRSFSNIRRVAFCLLKPRTNFYDDGRAQRKRQRRRIKPGTARAKIAAKS